MLSFIKSYAENTRPLPGCYNTSSGEVHLTHSCGSHTWSYQDWQAFEFIGASKQVNEADRLLLATIISLQVVFTETMGNGGFIFILPFSM